MQIAIVLYPGFTALDFIGPYEVLRNLPDAEVRFVWHEPGPIAADSGVLVVGATHSFDETPSPDVILVPGGMSHHRARARREAARLGAPGARDHHVDDVGVLRLGDPGRGRAARRASGPRRTGWRCRCSRRSASTPVGDERIVHEGKTRDVRGRVRRARHGAVAGRPDRRRGARPRPSSSSSSTTRSRRSTPATCRRRRRRPRRLATAVLSKELVEAGQRSRRRCGCCGTRPSAPSAAAARSGSTCPPR